MIDNRGDYIMAGDSYTKYLISHHIYVVGPLIHVRAALNKTHSLAADAIVSLGINSV